MKKIMLLIAMFVLLALPVIAPAPQSGSGNNNLEIKFPQYDVHDIDWNLKVHFHLFSRETGLPLTAADTLNCSFHLYNQTNSHIYTTWKNETDISRTYDIEVEVGRSNFTGTGFYNYIFQCWCDGCSVVAGYTDLGGFVSVPFEVTNDGEVYETYDGIITLALVLGSVLLAFLFIYFAFRLDDRHFLLQLLLIFFTIITILNIPVSIFAGNSAGATQLIKIGGWFFSAFLLYFLVYLFYHWVLSNEKLMSKFKRR